MNVIATDSATAFQKCMMQPVPLVKSELDLVRIQIQEDVVRTLAGRYILTTRKGPISTQDLNEMRPPLMMRIADRFQEGIAFLATLEQALLVLQDVENRPVIYRLFHKTHFLRHAEADLDEFSKTIYNIQALWDSLFQGIMEQIPPADRGLPKRPS